MKLKLKPALNLQIARVYLQAGDPTVATRTWQVAMDEMTKLKLGGTQTRHVAAMRDPAFDLIRDRVILETQAEHFLQVLRKGRVSTNVYLRRLHNFALDMNWLPWPVLPKKRWPAPVYKPKRAIRWEEHQAIVAREPNFAQEALGHSSKSVHRAYARGARMELPPLEDYEAARAKIKAGEPAVVTCDPQRAESLG